MSNIRNSGVRPAFERIDTDSSLEEDDTNFTQINTRICSNLRRGVHNTPSQKILEDEIQHLQEAKKKTFSMNDDDTWRMSVKQQLEVEIDSKVRQALHTPPLELWQRKVDQYRIRELSFAERDDLNAHLNLGGAGGAWLRDKRGGANLTGSRPGAGRTGHTGRARRSPNIMGDNGYDEQGDTEMQAGGRLNFSLAGARNQSDEPHANYSIADRLNGFGGFGANCDFSKPNFRVGKDAMMHFGSLTDAEKKFLFLNFTKEGFLGAMRSGKLPDGTLLEALPGNRYRDRYGIVRDRHGPFWPHEYGPLHGTPAIERFKMPPAEYLCDPQVDDDGDYQESNEQSTYYKAKWKNVQIVYDSVKSPRNYIPPPVGEGVCPSLIFESRFECGNLRQARRVGQFEYHLVLNTDLFTNRHTQWYCFKVQNAVAGVTYKFVILNLVKRSSLYCHGMQPLYYSEKEAKCNSRGWHRHGHHIRYAKNILNLQCPLLSKEVTYYQLEWQFEVSNSGDTALFAHCYPYTFTDLKNDIDTICSMRKSFLKREVLCETRAGNSCFLLTVSDPEIPSDSKLGVLVTARVHPGETNASWMMKGFLEFITSDSEIAQLLREKFIFKVVPMLNPDGVIVGNYRCSLSARDMNRNYRHPSKESFPTLCAVKKMLEEFSNKHQVILYCDMHGHSRKSNVFMYGCDEHSKDTASAKGVKSDSESFLARRLLPWLIAKEAPDKFSFDGCKFGVQKCKEATGRVVMWRQMGIPNSFTMEATFCGSNLEKNIRRRHFNVHDLEDMGRVFAQSILKFDKIRNDRSEQNSIIINMTRSVMQHILDTRGYLPTVQPPQLKPTPEETNEGGSGVVDSKATSTDQSSLARNSTDLSDATTNNEIENLLNNMSITTMDSCFKILEKLNSSTADGDSGSSDSDSETEPEMPEQTDWSKKIRKKKKKNTRRNRDIDYKIKTKETKALSALPAINTEAELAKPKIRKKIDNQLEILRRNTNFRVKHHAPFVNKYEGRSNGGIPCFSEERLIERATKRLFDCTEKEMELRRNHEVTQFIVQNASKINRALKYLQINDDGYSDGIGLARQKLESILRSADGNTGAWEQAGTDTLAEDCRENKQENLESYSSASEESYSSDSSGYRNKKSSVAQYSAKRTMELANKCGYNTNIGHTSGFTGLFVTHPQSSNERLMPSKFTVQEAIRAYSSNDNDPWSIYKPATTIQGRIRLQHKRAVLMRSKEHLPSLAPDFAVTSSTKSPSTDS